MSSSAAAIGSFFFILIHLIELQMRGEEIFMFRVALIISSLAKQNGKGE